MSVVYATSGATTSDGFVVAAQVTSGISATLEVSTNDSFTDSEIFGPAVPNDNDVAKIRVTGLASNSIYFWRVIDNGTPDHLWIGRVKTHGPVGTVQSFSFAAFGDMGQFYAAEPPENTQYITDWVSNRPTLDTVRNEALDFTIFLGDLHYRNISSGSLTEHRDAIHDVLTFNGTLGYEARAGRLFRSAPWVYMWDDHDFDGGNSDGTYIGKEAVARAYRESIPHYPLPASGAYGGIFQSFQIGRVLFICFDSRYYRDPDGNPEGPNHTMLGDEQMAWLENLLSSSTASALIVCSQNQWLGPYSAGSDSWRGFNAERTQIGQWFVEYGWAPDKMIMLQADKHSLAIDDGSINDWGGFTTYLCAGLDAHPGGNAGAYSEGTTGDDRGQYGVFRVTDLGDQIVISGSLFIEDTLWNSYTVVIPAEPPDVPDPDDPDEIPPESEAEIRRRVTWYACNLLTGAIIRELPDLQGQVSRVIGAYTNHNLKLPIPLSGPASIPYNEWEPATHAGTTMLVAVLNDVPTWAGIILHRRGGTDDMLDLSCVSLEGYFERRYVVDHLWTQRDEASIIARGIIEDANNINGIGLIIDAPPTGKLRTREYKSDDDATVYERLRQLAAVEEGIEWTIDVEWANEDRTHIAKIVRVRNRIGVASDNPAAVFSTVGESEAAYKYDEDYTTGRGANYVIAVSSGQGESRPQSDPFSDIRPGFPRYEYRFTPGSSISSKEILNDHAEAELELQVDGAKTFELEARWNAKPRYGLDWKLGDDVAWDLVGYRHPPQLYRNQVVFVPQTVSYVGGDSGGTQSTESFSLTYPGVVQEGDSAFIWWSTDDTGGQPTPPFGFEVVNVYAGASGSQIAGFYRRLCDGTESGTVLTLTSGAANRHSGILVVYRGTHTVDPFDTYAVQDTAASGTTHTSPAVNVSHEGGVILATYQERASGGTTDAVIGGSFTRSEHTGSAAFGNGGTYVAGAHDLTGKPPGIYTPSDWTGDISTDNVVTWSVALRPALVEQTIQIPIPGPNGVRGKGRVIGFTLDMQNEIIKPVLLNPDDEPEI